MTRFSSLLKEVHAWPAQGHNFDAMIVPASRPSLSRVITLSARLDIPLVLLCSREAEISVALPQVERVPGVRVLIVWVPKDYQSPAFTPMFTDGRDNDLPLKLNLGLLYARLRGWQRILYVNDDISDLTPSGVTRIDGCLNVSPIAATSCRSFPDNSVVYHCRRLAGIKQDVFVGGGTFGVNVASPSVSFFMDAYNEDWFFFMPQVKNRSLAYAGNVSQDVFDPFADPNRATDEEFGDLIAEGLYAHLSGDDLGMTSTTDPGFWSTFKDRRLEMINSLIPRITDDNALQSLKHSLRRLGDITVDECVECVELWHEDQVRWHNLWRLDVRTIGERDALTALGLTTWSRIEMGDRR